MSRLGLPCASLLEMGIWGPREKEGVGKGEFEGHEHCRGCINGEEQPLFAFWIQY